MDLLCLGCGGHFLACVSVCFNSLGWWVCWNPGLRFTRSYYWESFIAESRAAKLYTGEKPINILVRKMKMLFGTKFSSLARLWWVPVTWLKNNFYASNNGNSHGMDFIISGMSSHLEIWGAGRIGVLEDMDIPKNHCCHWGCVYTC